MVLLLKKLFIKNYQDVSNPEVRNSYGKFSGLLGIVANSFLFVIKLIAGLLSGSVSVIADAINNLTDFITSIITLLGFKISGKPADKDHPFGHARFEYISALLIAAVIFFIGIEIGRSAIDKIFNATPTNFTIITCIILAVSILIKLFLSITFTKLSRDVNSEPIKAMGKDSLNDVVATSIVLICAIIGIFTELQLDGYLGILVCLFVLKTALTLIKETIDPLIGKSPDEELIKNIQKLITSYDGILGIHELIVHNYGPTQTFATVHIEVDSKVEVMISHELSDTIERDCLKQLNVHLVCHLDPINLSDEETVKITKIVNDIIKDNFERVSVHDLRIVKGPTFTNVIFDAVIPYDKPELKKEIKEKVELAFSSLDKTYYAVIEFENTFS